MMGLEETLGSITNIILNFKKDLIMNLMIMMISAILEEIWIIIKTKKEEVEEDILLALKLAQRQEPSMGEHKQSLYRLSNTQMGQLKLMKISRSLIDYLS